MACHRSRPNPVGRRAARRPARRAACRVTPGSEAAPPVGWSQGISRPPGFGALPPAPRTVGDRDAASPPRPPAVAPPSPVPPKRPPSPRARPMEHPGRRSLRKSDNAGQTPVPFAQLRCGSSETVPSACGLDTKKTQKRSGLGAQPIEDSDPVQGITFWHAVCILQQRDGPIALPFPFSDLLSGDSPRTCGVFFAREKASKYLSRRYFRKPACLRVRPVGQR
jgi:hypothetical protein